MADNIVNETWTALSVYNPRWEYLWVYHTASGDDDIMHEAFNRLGGIGWELVQNEFLGMTFGRSRKYCAIFKRQLADEVEE